MLFPHLRTRLVLVAAIAIVPLAVVAKQHPPAPHQEARLAAAAPAPSSYRSFDGSVAHFTPEKSGRTWAGRSYLSSTWSSPWVTPAHPFTQLVPSWSAATPAGTAVQVLVQVRDDAGHTSTTKSLGHWALRDGSTKRASSGAQSDAVARVATDTVLTTGRVLTSYRLTVRLLRPTDSPAPALRAVGAVTSTPSAVPATSLPLSAKAISLGVPRYSQMTHRGQDPQYGGGGEAWCSPTSLSMVLGYYRRLPSPSTYTWVPSRYTDRFVNHVARLTYDYAYEGNGNWPFNTAYAATRTGTAFVTRLAGLRMAERFVRVGIPLVLSIRFARGGLSGAPISSTAGHLVVLTGFTAAGNPVVNDPAAASNATVRRVYDRDQFERAWLRSGGTAYVVRDAKHPLPPRPRGVTAW